MVKALERLTEAAKPAAAAPPAAAPPEAPLLKPLSTALKTLSLEAAKPAAAAPPAAAPPEAPLLKPLSTEQAAVVHAFVSGDCNVAVDAVAGSGKTTSILHAAAALRAAEPGARVLVLTYNARLKEETRRKVRALGLDGSTEVHSFHAFGVKHYSPGCFNDDKLLRVVVDDTPPLRRFAFDRIVVDEAQDVTPLFYRFVCKLMRDSESAQPCPVLLLGDQHQSIFGFREADARYLTLAAAAFQGIAPALLWRSLALSTTFRLTGNMVAFLNASVLRRPHFNTPNAPGDPVYYYRGNPFEIVGLVADKLLLALSRGKLQPADIFVLSQHQRRHVVQPKSVQPAGAQAGQGALPVLQLHLSRRAPG